MIRWERLTDTLGTTAKGEYLPIWVQQFPDVSLDAQYAAGGPIERLSPADLPEGARIVDARYGAQSAELGIETPVAFRARYLAFYYPGWRATVDGAPVAVAPEAGSGLLTFEVPAGEHTVEVWFGETPIRWGGDGLSVSERGRCLWSSRSQKTFGVFLSSAAPTRQENPKGLPGVGRRSPGSPPGLRWQPSSRSSP